jgi:deoxyadenosine/deoxycytidine kinase
MKRPKHIAFVTVVGNIGVGKTTFAEKVAHRLGWKVFYENVANNPYLPDYYADMDRWSFHLQIYFLTHRFRAQLEIPRLNRSCIQDRSIYEDPEIFAYVLHRQGHLAHREYRTYLDLFRTLEPFLPQPDLFIYLRASTWTLLSRIRKRGREFEKGITAEFLHELNLAYERWIRRLKVHHPVLIIDTDGFDISRDEQQFEKMLTDMVAILRKRGKTGLRLPSSVSHPGAV